MSDLPVTDHDRLLTALSEPRPYLTEPLRILAKHIIENDITSRRAWAVRRHLAAGAGRSEREGGAFARASEECFCSPSACRYAFERDEERMAGLLPMVKSNTAI